VFILAIDLVQNFQSKNRIVEFHARFVILRKQYDACHRKIHDLPSVCGHKLPNNLHEECLEDRVRFRSSALSRRVA